jgi:hypothetical protein
MLNETIIIKIQQRLNKLSSNDFQNLASWQILEAFNTAQLDGTRIALKDSADVGTMAIEDFQSLLVEKSDFLFFDTGDSFQTSTDAWPTNFLRNNRLDLSVVSTCCSTPKKMVAYLAEESNVPILLNDVHRKPNYDWGETFFVLSGNTIKIYHSGEFTIDACNYIYYREPRRVQIAGVRDVYQNAIPTTNVTCEFSDNVTEVFIFGAAALLAGDMGSFEQMGRMITEQQRLK